MLSNALAVLRRYLPKHNLILSAQSLILQNELGHHIYTQMLAAGKSLLRHIREFLAYVKKFFLPRRIRIDWQHWNRTEPRLSGAVYPVLAVKVQNGAVWQGFAYGPGSGLLWRKYGD